MLIPEKIQKSNPIKFNTKEIQESLQKTGIYQKDSFTIKIWLDADEYSEDNTKIQEDERENNMVGEVEKEIQKGPDKNGVYQIVDEMPKFPGGEDALMEYVSKNVVYPKEAQEKGISGRVFVEFIVEKDGSVSNVNVLRGIGGGCDEEAVRVFSSMPKWKPGKQDGKPVRVSYQMPINFKLQ